MSAFMMTEESIARIAAYIEKYGVVFEEQEEELKEILKAYKGNTFVQLYRALEDMNIKALVARHHDDPAELRAKDVPLHPCIESFMKKRADQVQLHKTFCCYLYQCSEGDVTDTKLYRIVRNIANDMGCTLLESTDEWRNMRWM